MQGQVVRFRGRHQVADVERRPRQGASQVSQRRAATAEMPAVAVRDTQAEQALADHAEAFERTQNEIDQILISLKRLRGQLETLPDIEQAQSSLGNAERGLLAASPSEASAIIAQVTNARENLRRARLSRTDALAEYHSNVILLSRAIGRDLYE